MERRAILTGMLAAGCAAAQTQITEAERKAATAAHFDKVYRSETPSFKTKPNALLVETASKMKPGTALDVSMGEGRNAVYLAKQGWKVTGFDISKEGLAIARAKAAEAGVQVEAVLASYEEFEWGKEKWDLIVMSYAFLPLREEALLKRVVESMKPGGRLVYEHFLPDPRRPGMPRNVLWRAFGGLHFLRYEDVLAQADWGNGEGHLGRLVAEKL